MQLTLIRHGEAAPATDGNDLKRELTELGHAQAQQTAKFIQSNVKPEVFVVSPLRRAQQTLAHIQTFFPDVPVLVCDNIKPEDDAKVAIEWLSQLPQQSIVVVCHMNVVGYMDEQLCGHPFSAFALAEARVYAQSVIAQGLSSHISQFIPSNIL